MNNRGIARLSRLSYATCIAALALLGWTAASPVNGTTYWMVSDADLARQATVIVEGSVLTAYPVDTETFPSTEYVVLPSRVLKGSVEGSTLIVRVIGGRGPSGRRFEVAGAPRFAAGDALVLFLRQNADDSYGLLHLGLGAFERAGAGSGESYAVRRLEGTVLGSETDERVRDYERFVGWLGRVGKGERADQDYLVAPADRFSAAYTLEKHNGMKVRWFDFDKGSIVGWWLAGSREPTDQKALANALAAWSTVKGPDVRLVYKGTSSADSGFQAMDSTNTVLFGDPNEWMTGRFDCSKGGVMAMGGWWSDEGTGSFAGETFYRILEGDVVVNDGLECYLGGDLNRTEAMLAHEVGHALGLGHSCGDSDSGECDTEQKLEAIMNARASDDTRGAALNRDDREALAALYGELEPEEIEAPSALKAKLLPGDRVKLTWKDNSDGEECFEIYLKVGREEWQLWKSAGSDKTRLKGKLDVAGGGKVLFRARALGEVEESGFSNLARLRMR